MTSYIFDKAKDVLNLNKDGEIEIAGRKVYGTGYGLMGLTWRASPPSQEQAFDAMKTALHSGANFWNGGELYGTPERNSLHLLKEYFDEHPSHASKVVISIKGGLVKGGMKPDGSAGNTRRSIDECLNVMTNKKLDIWEAARCDPDTPIEITMRAANEYVKAGKLGGISLSECSEDTIRRAAKEVTVAAVEVEFSLWSTEILDNGVAKACAELNIPIVAYSPLGRGFLTGQIKKLEDIPEGDFRRSIPRFFPENFDKNLELVTQLEELAKRKGCKPVLHLGLAWVRAQGRKPGMPTIIPIPGASTSERVKENLVEIDLSENDLKEIDSLLASVQIVGGRYGEHGAHLEFGSTPPLKE
ncbi:hypothetical protein DOTSEDRAFT_68570 [Dothistroma septosporum NZE10]|uniref:NADP-dependent oxidoreductase domain-containing protein n=1 Tax=Dothistroma septosporum (strain NZE10 / CBS 128990) TaxID=675120 RepID=N1Q4P0_DOTSN|nr:hypothetical protein DOTSEDRAFT_68570 [Dothistroma septosporum NZE10]